MISATQLRNGTNFLYRGDPHRVLQYRHRHMSRGGGTIKVKVINFNSGANLQLSFKSSEEVEEIIVNKNSMQFLYQDGNEYVFMDPNTFEQVTISQKTLGDDAQYLKEGEDVYVLSWEHDDVTQYLGVDLPAKMNFKVVQAAPGEKGNSASNVYKDAKLENDMMVRVPLFIEKGDTVRISTEDGKYVERV